MVIHLSCTKTGGRRHATSVPSCNLWWLLVFAFTLGFGTTVAEPALIAISQEAAAKYFHRAVHVGCKQPDRILRPIAKKLYTSIVEERKL